MPFLRYCLLALALGSGMPLLAKAELAVTGVDRDIERNIRAFVSLAGETCESEDWLVRRRFRVLESPSGFGTVSHEPYQRKSRMVG